MPSQQVTNLGQNFYQVVIPPGHVFKGSTGYSYPNHHTFSVTINVQNLGVVTPIPPGTVPVNAPTPLLVNGSSSPTESFIYTSPVPATPNWTAEINSPGLIEFSEHPMPPEPKNLMKDNEEFCNKKLNRLIMFKNGNVSGDIGLEIECEGINLFRTPFKYWTCHEDGSLRSTGSHAPVEYVLKQPVKVEKVREALEYLHEKLRESGSKVINSNRCSVHVHVNCQKITVRELYCYLCIYGIFEELLIEWSSPERAGNLFCQRAKDSDFYVHMLENTLKTSTFKLWKEEYRYSACNVASIPKFGSLEFRSMKGTIDVDLIELWVKLLVHLKTIALSYDSPVVIIEDFINLGPLPFFKKVFKGTKYHELFEHIPGLSGKLWDGLRIMRDVAYACEWKPPVKKKENENSTNFVEMRYRQGDLYLFGSKLYTVCAKDYGKWAVKDANHLSEYDYEVPLGLVMYYINPVEYLQGTWFIVDVRQGEIEYTPEYDPNIQEEAFYDPPPEEEPEEYDPEDYSPQYDQEGNII